MRERLCFVSNSSSSSFVIIKKDLTESQIDHIFNHIAYNHLKCKKGEWSYDLFGDSDSSDEWSVSDSGDTLKCSTVMDNFDLKSFCFEIGVKPSQIKDDDYDIF